MQQRILNSVVRRIVIVTLLLNILLLLYLIAWRVSRSAVPTCAVGAPFIFSDTCETVSLFRENLYTINAHAHALPPPHRRPLPVHRRRHGRGPNIFYVPLAVSVGHQPEPEHDDRVTDHSRRLQQIRQGEWTVIIIIVIVIGTTTGL